MVVRSGRYFHNYGNDVRFFHNHGKMCYSVLRKGVVFPCITKRLSLS
nr:MAG TPA: hypothetical protein [Caudoviricetes sp.]